MHKPIYAAKVFLWGMQIGAVVWDEKSESAIFSYAQECIKSGLQPSPLYMPISDRMNNRFSFGNLNRDTFWGLPGMLADALPDKFGNALIDVWLAKHGRSHASMNPVEKLLYMGDKSMGALEFYPSLKKEDAVDINVDMTELLKLTNDIMKQKDHLDISKYSDDALTSILQIGTSAGGARPKGIIAVHKETKHIISGHAVVPKDYEHWIIKFDGVSDMELGKPQGYGRIEFAYYLMALDAGINMATSELWKENGRAHFMTKRFDRVGGKKIHMQSLCGLAHYDFNMAGTYSYEQALMVALQLGLNYAERAQLFKRMVFNVIARNQDDHTKNIAFLMSENGEWSLSPAFDVTYSHNPSGIWTHQHQMTLAGKRDGFTHVDLVKVGESSGIKNTAAIINEVMQAVFKWKGFASEAGVMKEQCDVIEKNLRLKL